MDTSILETHLLIIKLEIGTSWIIHLSNFILMSTLPWNTQRKSKWIVENNTNALRKIRVAVGNLNNKILLNGVKNFNFGIWKINYSGVDRKNSMNGMELLKMGIWKITRVCIEINEWHGATKMKTILTKSSTSTSILHPVLK